jgi:ATP-binding cassette subfamily B protein
VVSQNDFLFDTSLRENMTFGLDEGVPDERISHALGLVDLWDDVQRLKGGLSTPFSPHLFSGGQKQRFFIARALLREPSIVLLDEPTSALDFETEKRVIAAIDQLVGKNTTITIAHRLSTVRNADRVIVMRDGRIEASGTHDELYQASGYYRALCEYNSFMVA